MSKKYKIVPEQLIKTRDTVIRACSIDTCIEEMVPHYEITQNLALAWGSNVVAVMLFVGENWLRGHKNWFPIAVEKTKFDPGFRRYLMMFQPERRILCDFSIDFCFGGAVDYDPASQDSFLKDFLDDPTLEKRLPAGMRNFGLQVPVTMLIDTFAEAFHVGKKYQPEKLFAQQDG